MPETTEPQVDPDTEAFELRLRELIARRDVLAVVATTFPLDAKSAWLHLDAMRAALAALEGTATSLTDRHLKESGFFDTRISRMFAEKLKMLPQERPDADDEAQAALSDEIDAIAKRLDEEIPRLSARLDQLLERQRRPLTTV